MRFHCSICLAAEPVSDGMLWPPNGILLETPAQIAREARRIYPPAAVSQAMSPASLSYIEPPEREAIVRWFQGAGVEGRKTVT